MTHKDLLASLQKVCRRDSQHCSIMLNALCKLMAQAGVEQVPVTLPGLGTFTSHKHPEYIQEDKQSGRQTLYPPRITYRMNPEEETAYEGTTTQPDLLEQQLAKQSDSSVEEAGVFIKALIDSILSSLDRGESVELHGLGLFQIVSSRQGELQRVAYTPDEQMRQAVNAPFECFEPVPIVDPTSAVTAPAIVVEEPEETEPEEPIIVTPLTNIDMKESEDPEQNKEQPVVVAEPEPIAAAESEPVAIPEPEEPEPAEPIKEFKPVDAVVSGEPVSISDHYQEFADERKKTPLIYASAALLVLACIALGWFIYKLERPGADTYTYNRDVIEQAYQEKTDEPAATEEVDAPEVFFGEAEEVTVEEPVVDDAEVKAEAEAQAAAEAARIAAEKEAAEKEAAEKIAAEKAAAEKAAAEKAAAEKAAAEKAAAQKQAAEKAANTTSTTAASNNATVGRLKNADGSYATHKLEAGSRLTLVALEHYGDKAFWPYVYEVNRDKLKSPSLVQPGMVLYLPDPKHFGIDANDPASVAKAKAKAAQYLK